MDSLTEPNPSVEPTIYSPTDISLLIAGIAAAFATIVYSCKHIKKSSCCGFNCEQVVVDDPSDEPHELSLVVDDHQNNSDILMQSDLLTNNKLKNSTDV
jgi:hypothetical protein